ncbi:hypothetical protein SEVIR_2G238600v4 [Setaria viridis]|uniref:NAC domain-containing protein n=1 Tax=Setaria viridis TaxID=4556 RepID=A0A4V6DBG0_SETVI|nr:NAC domain-containing protein 71-like [Setaria viridis]TKW33476.1 hypothetical protein SEVIR_2G238600v2 [Setaria viridis]
MEGGGEKKYPIGFRFKPKDEELVEYYLLPRLQGRPTVPNDSVIEASVYDYHPDRLTNEYKSGGQEEWYFLSSRARMYGNGVRPARKTRDGRGRWKASTATKEVAEEVVCNGIKFCKSVLNYFEGNPKKEARTKWIMLELTVPEYEIKLDKPGAKNMLDEYVMCKIYVSPQHKKKGDADDDEEGTSSAFEEEEEEACSSTPHGQGTAESMHADKQAGKRPMVEQPPQRGSFAPARKQARQGSLSTGSATQASYSSTSNAASSTEAYCGGLGQLTGAHCGLQFQAPPMPRPAGAYNGQAPAKPPAGACGGWGLVQLPTPTPVLYQPFADPTDDDPFGQMAATMTRPTTPANQAARLPGFPGSQPPRHPGTGFRPQVSLQCCYDQNYRPVQVQQPPPGNASSSQLQGLPAFLPQQQMLQPFLNGGANRRAGAAAVPRGPSYNGYPYQRTSLAPTADGHGGAANEKNGAARFNVNAEQFFVDLATINPSLAGGCTQPAPVGLVKPPAPAAARPVESPAPRGGRCCES